MSTAAPAPPMPVRYALRFTGQAGEYFRIWIVNLSLTIVTLGLYGPWAKVRTRKYFYGNLVLDGASFAYDADPRRILIGRSIVLGFTAGIALLQALSPVAGALAPLLLLPAAPWLLTRSLAFHHRNSSYRNVRFRFDATIGDAAAVIFGGPLAVLLTLGLAYPWYLGRFQQFQVANSHYGKTPFSFGWTAGPYYRAFGAATLWLLAIAFPLCLLIAMLGAALDDPQAGAEVMILGFMGGYIAAIAVVNARLQNLFYANARLGEVRFESRVRARDLAHIYGLGGLAVIASLGLALPWLLVRIARYRAEQTTVVAAASLDSFSQTAGAPDPKTGAFADEAAAGWFDFDFGL